MPSYRVKFINKLLSSDGHPFNAVQRVVHVADAGSADEAARQAQHDFARLECIGDWRCHARYMEVEPEPDDNGRPEKPS